MSARLGLGTAQFGLRYGVANAGGQVSLREARAILDHAAAAGISLLDTAIAYGESESRLGQLDVAHWHVVSKLPPLAEGCGDVGAWVRNAVQGSLERLRIRRLYGLLLHEPRDLLGGRGPALNAALLELRERGTVHKVGLSVYDPEELEAVWPRFPVDIVQAPFNIVDRRIAASGWLARLHEAGTEVHVRSAFLQGLLVMGAARRPPRFARWQRLWHQWDQWLSEQRLTPLAACLRFVLARPEIRRVIVGVDCLAQLREIIAASTGKPVMPPESLATNDPELVNPSRWNAP
jgi:aryl-alcohol dehydrogenase-like predicted oxidoreductase